MMQNRLWTLTLTPADAPPTTFRDLPSDAMRKAIRALASGDHEQLAAVIAESRDGSDLDLDLAA